MVANFRTYEGQLRLLTAVIAAHPELKLNYKELAKHFGSDWTESGLEHFFRPIKKNAKEIQGLVRRGEDAAKYDHKMGRGSTGGNAPTTPSSAGPKTPRTAGSRKRTAPSAPSTGKSASNKKQKGSSVKFADILNPNFDDDDSDEVSPVEMTPTKTGIRIDHEKMAAHERAMGIIYPNETPALDPTQTITSDDEDEVRILTPADARPSFPSKKSATQAPAADSNDAFKSADQDSSNLFSSYVSAPTGQGFVDVDHYDSC